MGTVRSSDGVRDGHVRDGQVRGEQVKVKVVSR